MAPVKMKTRSEIGVKEALSFKPKHAPAVSKRKADGSPLKTTTTTQVKRHLVDGSVKENNVLMKTKAQLMNLTHAAKKPLGIRNNNTTVNNISCVVKDGKVINNASNLKKDVPKGDPKENIVNRASMVKMTDIKLVKVTTTVTMKAKETKVDVSKVVDSKKATSKPQALKDVNKGQGKTVEPKPKEKNDVKTIADSKEKVPVVKPANENRRASLIPVPKKADVSVRTTGPVTRQSLSRRSTDNESTLYESALEDILNDTSGSKKSAKPPTLRQVKTVRKRPPGVEDFDSATQDLFSVGKFAFEIFEYLKSRESYFKVSNYMIKQKGITKSMRALLVDWLVEIQENFELNHETLYLAVKLIDLYLSKVIISKDHLQLLGCTAMLIACKYDERIAPLLDDFLDISDNHFTAKDIMNMELKVLKAINYELGCPLSYRFLRRYSRCAKFDMTLLTLARYILEMSLMEYSMAFESESKLAAAALYLAIRMKKESVWTPTLQYYSGYKVEDFKEIAINLNTMLHQKRKEKLMTIRKKYSHEVFHRVAEIPLLDQIDFPSS